MRLRLILFCLLVSASAGRADEPLTLKQGDRVVLLGAGMIEQFRRYGYLEAALTADLGTASVPFRNLGWAGDTVRGSARTGGYQNPDGLARLLKETKELQPTVIFLGYGTNESFDGVKALPGFLADYEKLLVALEPLKARIVLLSPTPLENLGPPFPDPTEQNGVLERYVAGIKDLAGKHKVRYVDLFRPILANIKHALPRRTSNGITLNADGTEQVAEEIMQQLNQVELMKPVEEAQAYRKAIVARDELFYRRWRPFNDHSRHFEFMKGDGPLYDAEIAAAERAIVTARPTREMSK